VGPERNDYISNWVPLALPMRILLLNTFHPGAEQCHSGESRVGGPRRMLRWRPSPAFPVFAWISTTRSVLWTTIFLGLGFLRTGLRVAPAGRGNLTFATNASSSFFFILTGVHAVHLVGGS